MKRASLTIEDEKAIIVSKVAAAGRNTSRLSIQKES